MIMFMLNILFSFAAYLPPWLFIIVQNILLVFCVGENDSRQINYHSLVIVGVFVILILVSWIVVLVAARNSFYCQGTISEYRLISARERKTVSVGFVIENIFPALVFDLTSPAGLLCVTVWLIIVSSVAATHHCIGANVFLDWMGWTLYECEMEQCGVTRTMDVWSKSSMWIINGIFQVGKVNNEVFVNMGEVT